MICSLVRAETSFRIYKPLPYGSIRSVIETISPERLAKEDFVVCHSRSNTQSLEKQYSTKDCKQNILKDTEKFGIVVVECSIGTEKIKMRIESTAVSPTKHVVKIYNESSKLETIVTQTLIGDCK